MAEMQIIKILWTKSHKRDIQNAKGRPERNRFVPKEDWEGSTVKGSELFPENGKKLFTWKTISRQEGSTCRGVEAQKSVVCEGKSKAKD